MRGKMVNNYLTGKCLVSRPDIADERFAKSVIYICTHSKDGAVGLVINKQLQDFCFSDLAEQLNITYPKTGREIILYAGGPVEKIRGFILHSREHLKDGTVVVDNNFAVSSSVEMLNDIAFGIGPRYNLIALGYSSWISDQLEQEIIDDTWLVIDSNQELLFETRDEDKWQKAVDSLGFDIMRISNFSGRA